MAQILVGSDAVSDNLLKLLDLGEPSSFSPRSDGILTDANLEDVSGAGNQRNLADIGRKGRWKLLRYPSGPEKPAAFHAVFDFNSRLCMTAEEFSAEDYLLRPCPAWAYEPRCLTTAP
jgi:hypothetical protein